MSAEDEIKQAMGELLSGSSGVPLRNPFPMAGDTESRLVALEHNFKALYRGLLDAARQIQDLRDSIDRT